MLLILTLKSQHAQKSLLKIRARACCSKLLTSCEYAVTKRYEWDGIGVDMANDLLVLLLLCRVDRGFYEVEKSPVILERGREI